MKRKGNLYHQICSWNNVFRAYLNATSGKSDQSGVKKFNKDLEGNTMALREAFIARTYRTSSYQHKTIYEPKERQIAILSFADRVAQHMILNVIAPDFVAYFTADTYASIPGRGVHKLSYKLRKAVKDVPRNSHYLQLDVQKFYPSVNHDVLKALLRRKYKDADLLRVLDEIIDSHPGLPIGNYMSQWLANFYLTELDRYIKQKYKVNYYRYSDDIVITHSDKKLLHIIARDIITWCLEHRKLTVKLKYKLAPVALHGINVGGYKHYATHVALRPSIKKRFAKAVARRAKKQTIEAYKSWAKHANCLNLLRKLLPHEYDTRI